MLPFSPEYYERIIASDRTGFRIKAVMNGQEVTGEHIINMELTETLSSGPNIEMGETCSAKLEINMRMPETAIGLHGAEILAYSGLTLSEGIEWIPLGKFFVSKIDTKTNYAKIKITAFDGMSRLQEPYIATITEWPALIQSVAEDICTQAIVELDEDIDWPEYTIPAGAFEEEFTCQQMIGYIAGMMGKNARFNREGKLTFAWYAPVDYSISRETIYQNGFEQITAEPISLSAILTGTEEDTISAGEGRAIAFSNPFITQEIADNIADELGTFTYVPAKAKWRGNPVLEVGDVVTVEDSNGLPCDVPITTQTMHLKGGLLCELKAHGTSETENRISKAPTEVKLRRMYAGLTAAFQAATQKMSGALGGYFIIETDELGFPSGWIIADTPTITPYTKLWRMNSAGLAWSGNGGATYSNIAITMDGQISANAITVGSLSAERIAVENYGGEDEVTLQSYIRFEDGAIILGKADNEMAMKIVNDRVSIISGLGTPGEKTVAYFSNNSLEIVDVERVRFGSFGFVPRANGNLSFTKVV